MPNLSALTPFYFPVFRQLWLALFLCNLGFWLQLQTTILLLQEHAPTSILITWTQCLYILPALLCTLIAGACADCYPPRWLLIYAQCLMLLTSVGLLLLKGAELECIALISLMAGIANAWRAPVWQTVIPKIVPASYLTEALGLSSINFNLARILGPLVAAALAFWMPISYLFSLNILFSLFFMLLLWTVSSFSDDKCPMRFSWAKFGIALAGYRDVFTRKDIRKAVDKTFLITLTGSAIFMLIPVAAQDKTGFPGLYTGIFLMLFGIGGIAMLFLIPRLRRLYTGDILMRAVLGLQFVCTLLFAHVDAIVILIPILIIAGGSWILMVTTLNTALQQLAPAGLRGRTMALYITSLNGGIGIGSLIWGALAEFAFHHALLLASCGLASLIFLHLCSASQTVPLRSTSKSG